MTNETIKDKKKLIIGGVVALVLISGIVLASTNKQLSINDPILGRTDYYEKVKTCSIIARRVAYATNDDAFANKLGNLQIAIAKKEGKEIQGDEVKKVLNEVEELFNKSGQSKTDEVQSLCDLILKDYIENHYQNDLNTKTKCEQYASEHGYNGPLWQNCVSTTNKQIFSKQDGYFEAAYMCVNGSKEPGMFKIGTGRLEVDADMIAKTQRSYGDMCAALRNHYSIYN